MCMGAKVDGYFWKIVQQIEPCNTYHTCTFIHRRGKNHKPYGNGVDKRIWNNLANNKNLWQVTTPINFIASTRSKKHRTRTILTMKMGQTLMHLKPNHEGFLCWSSLLCTKHDHCTFCPYLTFVFKFPLACKWRMLEQNITIEHGRKKVHIFNSHCGIIQRP